MKVTTPVGVPAPGATAFTVAVMVTNCPGVGDDGFATTLVVVFVTPPADYSTLWQWQPSIVTGTLWMFTATALLVVWYQVPVHDWQRAIMLGLVSYLVVFVLYMDLLRRFGWEHHLAVGWLDVFAYLGLCIFWAWAAWRRDPSPVRAEAAA